MNFVIKLGADALLKGNLKKKIIIFAVASFLPLFLTVVVISKAIAPFAEFIEGVQELGDKASNFFQAVGERTENFFQGRWFTIIDEEKVEAQEQKVYDKLELTYKKFDKYVQIDLPLIAATIYYPMDFIYDEDVIEELNNLDGKTEAALTEEAIEEQNQKAYDYFKMIRGNKWKTSYIDKLANHSISQTITTYKCDVKTYVVEGEEKTYYMRGEQTSTTGVQDFDGTLKDDESCAKGIASIQTYIYQNDPERYDTYLKNAHIFDNKSYSSLFENLDAAAKTEQLNSVVDEIHDLASLYASIFDVDQMIAGGYTNLCTSGVIVVAGEGGAGGVYNLEDYVAGVVSHENTFYEGNNIESMKAQAIAARTYVLSHTNMCANPIVNSTEAQTFYEDADPVSMRAANETAGMVLTYNGKIFSSEYDAFFCNEVATCIAGADCSCEYIKEPFIDASGSVTTDVNNAVNRHIVSIPTDAIRYGGKGHGRGMSQEVSNYLQSNNGYTYEQILNYFYAEGVQIYNFSSTGPITYVPSVAFKDTDLTVAYHNQGDYDGVSYGGIAGADIKSHGCGPTSMAIALSTFVRETSPVVTTNWACSNGYCTSGGTDHDFFCAMAEAEGLYCEEINSTNPSSLDRVVKEIENGSLVIGYMRGPSAFTFGGHYIVMRGILNEKNSKYKYGPYSKKDDDGNNYNFTIDKGAPYVLVADPASTDRTNNYAFSLSYVASNTKNPPFIIIRPKE